MSKRRFPGIHQLPLVIIKLSSAVRAKTGERQLHYVPNASWESASASWTKMHLQVGRINPSAAFLWFLSKLQSQCIGAINVGGILLTLFCIDKSNQNLLHNIQHPTKEMCRGWIRAFDHLVETLLAVCQWGFSAP